MQNHLKDIEDRLSSIGQRLTLSDLRLASAYFPILMAACREKRTLYYSELVSIAKSMFPENPFVQSAVDVSVGRRLNTIRAFTDIHGFPDITSLVISKATEECGSGFPDDPSHVRNKVYMFEWKHSELQFDLFVESALVHITEQRFKRKKKISRKEALEMIAEFYQKNKDSLPKEIRQQRDTLLELLLDGYFVEDAFDKVVLQVDPIRQAFAELTTAS